MAFFTKTIYNAIMLSVSGGDISPLVGHNAFLRWAYMKECAFQGTDGQTKYWSDAHVSEDFDIAIRFQVILACLRQLPKDPLDLGWDVHVH